MKNTIGKIKLQLIVAVLIVASLLVVTFYRHFMINVTLSMPKGIYYDSHKKTPDDRDMIAICLPTHLRRLANENGYTFKGVYCHGTSPLIKQVIAVPGDNVLVADNSITVNSRCYLVKRFTQDSHGRALSHYPNGHYIAKAYWVLGTNSDRSWDSRYFGELPAQSILCTLKPLITW